jgi:hypothetical protein
MTLEFIVRTFTDLLGIDVQASRNQAYMDLFTNALDQTPDELVRSYTQRFTARPSGPPFQDLSYTRPV